MYAIVVPGAVGVHRKGTQRQFIKLRPKGH